MSRPNCTTACKVTLQLTSIVLLSCNLSTFFCCLVGAEQAHCCQPAHSAICNLYNGCRWPLGVTCQGAAPPSNALTQQILGSIVAMVPPKKHDPPQKSSPKIPKKEVKRQPSPEPCWSPEWTLAGQASPDDKEEATKGPWKQAVSTYLAKRSSLSDSSAARR